MPAGCIRGGGGLVAGPVWREFAFIRAFMTRASGLFQPAVALMIPPIEPRRTAGPDATFD
jgi:hypothetical protein